MNVGKLFRLPEIGVGGLGEALAFERDDALIALGVGAAVDGHREMALAQQPSIGWQRVEPLLREARIAAQAARHLIVGDQEIDRPVGGSLENELALEFQRRAEQRGQRHRLAEQLRHGVRIGVARQDGVDHRPELHQPARDIRLFGLERQDEVVLWDAQLDARFQRMIRHRAAPRDFVRATRGLFA
jgi:hypothetical protein